MLNGSINHVSLTVSDLARAVEFFTPFLRFLGYELEGPPNAQLALHFSPTLGAAVNIWQAKPSFKDRPFEVYAPGLHHVAFNVAARAQIDELAELVPKWGGRVTDPPGEYGYTGHGSYYAIYFRGPDDMKIECVHMSELERLHRERGSLDARLWPHATG
jgi:catechol 2,3-dioxygenase-like lactoylglutathione lyase family enzyme